MRIFALIMLVLSLNTLQKCKDTTQQEPTQPPISGDNPPADEDDCAGCAQAPRTKYSSNE